MAMQTAQDLFIYELGDMYDAEQRIAQMLPQLANETDNPQVQQALQQHLTETQQQIQNIEQCFQIFGQRPTRESCMAIQGPQAGARHVPEGESRAAAANDV